MNNELNQILFSLIRGEVCGVGAEAGSRTISPEMLPSLYALADRHDLAHLVASALDKLGALPADLEISAKFRKKQMLAVFRYQQMDYELRAVCNALEAAAIDFVPLKGAVLRPHYPQAWMRTSCDLDVLIHEDDLPAAVSVLINTLGYKEGERGVHDVSLHSRSGIHVELHYTLQDEAEAEGVAATQPILDGVWQHVSPISQGAHQHRMTDAFFCYYHAVHMAKHFYNAGCGIRPFLDLWILEHRAQMDLDGCLSLCRQSGLERFFLAARALAGVWFSAESADETLLAMQEYVFTGGVYGNFENRVLARRRRVGGRLGYVLSRVFVSFEYLSLLYPDLKKRRWLFPIYQVRRWFRLLFAGRLKQASQELRAGDAMSDQRIQRTAALFRELGL